MLTPEQLADLREKAQATTPGPWEYREDKAFCDPNILEIHSPETPFIASFVKPLEAAFITAANPATVLQLLDMVERLDREADWLAQAAANGGMDGWRVSAELWREKARKAVRGDNCEP